MLKLLSKSDWNLKPKWKLGVWLVAAGRRERERTKKKCGEYYGCSSSHFRKGNTKSLHTVQAPITEGKKPKRKMCIVNVHGLTVNGVYKSTFTLMESCVGVSICRVTPLTSNLPEPVQTELWLHICGEWCNYRRRTRRRSAIPRGWFYRITNAWLSNVRRKRGRAPIARVIQRNVD